MLISLLCEEINFFISNWGNSLFWEEINLGYYQMRDEYLMNNSKVDPFNLSGRDSYYTFMMKK